MSKDHPFVRNERKQKMIEYMKDKNWKKILEEFDADETFREPLLVWIRPSLDLLQFLKETLLQLNIKKVVSVGCGCGFLEWLLVESTGLEVAGLEVNRSWWVGKHATPHFIDLAFTEPGDVPALEPTSALMFSYFNNSDYFHQYLANYAGPCVILIGPVDNERHCDPEPDYLEKNSKEWRVFAWHNIRQENQDRVVIYKRFN